MEHFSSTTALFLFQSDGGWEEYFDYIFPDDEAAQPNLKLLAMAKKWKKQQEEEEVTETVEETAES
jgi:crooked neck